jgi:hypothetical protein
LGRLVLLDEVPGNGETWFLGRCFACLRREGLAGVVLFSDPCRRLNREGVQVFGGHVGTVYQAHNAVYLGRGTPRTLALLPDGRVFGVPPVRNVIKIIDAFGGLAALKDRHIRLEVPGFLRLVIE